MEKERIEIRDTALLVHIKHTKPIEMNEFVSSLSALNGLYSSYVRKNGGSKEFSQSKLYVEKIEKGSIDIYLCDLVAATIIPFLENANVIMEFAGYVKKVYDYFMKGKGEKPSLDVQECDNFSDILNVVAADQGATMSIGAVNKTNRGNVFNNCTFNFGDSNSAQNQIGREKEIIKSVEPTNEIFSRVLMQIYQLRSDADSNKGNKAIIDEIQRGKHVPVVFESDILKGQILFSDANPTRKAFQVDVKVQTLNGKIVAYKVTALHDIIDLEDSF